MYSTVYGVHVRGARCSPEQDEQRRRVEAQRTLEHRLSERVCVAHAANPRRVPIAERAYMRTKASSECVCVS